MPREVNARMRNRTDTAANWTSANPILLPGELGHESDTQFFKFGNGANRWNDLPYAQADSGGGDITTAEPSATSRNDEATAASTMFTILGGNRSQLITDASSLIPAINEIQTEIDDMEFAIGNVPSPGQGEQRTGTTWHDGREIFVQTWRLRTPGGAAGGAPLGGNFAQLEIAHVPDVRHIVRTEVVNETTNTEYNFLLVRIGSANGSWSSVGTGPQDRVFLTNSLQTNLISNHWLVVSVFYTKVE